MIRAEIKTIQEQSSVKFDKAVNELLSDGWFIYKILPSAFNWECILMKEHEEKGQPE